MQPGALPDRERRAIVAVPPSLRTGPNSAARIRVVDANSSRTLQQRETAVLDGGRSANRPATERVEHRRRPPRALAKRQDSSVNGLGTPRTRFRHRRRERRPDPPASGVRLPSRPPHRHADRLVRSCALICDIRIGPSENSPAFAFSVRSRK